MLNISRRVGEALCLFDSDGKQIAIIRILPQRRKSQTSIGIDFDDSVSVKREEQIPDNDSGKTMVKFQQMMHRIGRSDLADGGMREALRSLAADQTNPSYFDDLLVLINKHEELKRNGN